MWRKKVYQVYLEIIKGTLLHLSDTSLMSHDNHSITIGKDLFAILTTRNIIRKVKKVEINLSFYYVEDCPIICNS